MTEAVIQQNHNQRAFNISSLTPHHTFNINRITVSFLTVELYLGKKPSYSGIRDFTRCIASPVILILSWVLCTTADESGSASTLGITSVNLAGYE